MPFYYGYFNIEMVLYFYFVHLQLMGVLYNCIVIITTFFLSILALFNKKMKLFVDGRATTFDKLSVFTADDKVVWFHAASLGEFEQGRPIIERLKQELPSYKILLTFFSPSGYEIRKDYELADVVCYLPMDSKKNVREFLEVVNPTMAIFIKYEFWPNYLKGLEQRDISTLLVSGIFRENQIFFKLHGGFMRKSLKAFDHFFVQDQSSQQLLNSIGLNNVTISGDTRFDRVYEILNQDNRLDFISEFKNNQYTVVAGSTWGEDEKLIVNYINNSASKDEKFIIAPHNMNTNAIDELKKSILKETVLYSEKQGKTLSDYDVFIVDTIGILTKIYSIADAAYVGGGLTKNGVHNILEPATYGVPIVIGPAYKKYKEVVDLVALNGCKVIANQNEFSTIFTKLKEDLGYRKQLGQINQHFIKENIGATKATMNYINSQLK